MSNCACLFWNTIQMHHIWCVLFLFSIDTVNGKIIVSFCYACNREQSFFEQLIGASCWNSSRYLLSSYYVSIYKYSICSISQLRIRTKVFLCSMFVSEDNKTNWILNPFYYQSTMTIMPLFEHVLHVICLYSSMCVWSKWVGSDKLLDYVFHFMDIHLIANVRYFVYTVIWLLLFLTHIWNLWGNEF